MRKYRRPILGRRGTTRNRTPRFSRRRRQSVLEDSQEDDSQKTSQETESEDEVERQYPYTFTVKTDVHKNTDEEEYSIDGFSEEDSEEEDIEENSQTSDSEGEDEPKAKINILKISMIKVIPEASIKKSFNNYNFYDINKIHRETGLRRN